MAADRNRDTKPAWLPLAAAALIVPTVLAGLTLLWPRPQIEGELTRTAGQALTAAGFTGAGLAVDGRDVTINGLPDGDRQRAIDAVTAVAGVRVARFPDAGSGGGPAPAPAQSPAPEPGVGAVEAQPFGIARRGEDVVLTGVVGTEAERAAFVAAATAQAGGRTVVDELTVTAGAPLPVGVDDASVGTAAGVLAAGAGDLAVSIAPNGVTLTGTVADEAAKAAAGSAIAAAVPGAALDNQLTVAPAAGGGAAGGELDAAAKQDLQGRIDQLVAGAPITFGPDSPQLTPQGRATVAKVLELVGPASGARLQVDGFVAPGRGNGRLTAQQLSDQRAATVRDALVAGGVPADRVVARGLGEVPATTADRAAGRRVDITVV